jgi:hypothetical protein
LFETSVDELMFVKGTIGKEEMVPYKLFEGVIKKIVTRIFFQLYA